MSFEAHGGEFTKHDPKHEMRYCRECKAQTPHTCDTWESSCGGFEDYRYVCTQCKTFHWVDGCDS